jgi:nitrogen fixation/metabolism regulation signal transduction histidine kinase
VLRDLGVVSELMPADAYEALTRRGEPEVTRDGPVPSLGERIGYRVIQPAAPAGLAVLATPEAGDDSSLAATQLDLALVLLLATLAGMGAALAGAGQAARALSRPVSELRRSALALGQGRPMPAHSPDPPSEFAPVFGAFERMAADVQASQRALEEARRRTAAVLATAATGVVALDPAGRVLLANPRARELLGTELPEGTPLLDALGAEWAELRDVVARARAEEDGGAVGAELTVGGRRLTVQLTAAGPDLPGVVLALNDVTDVSRAERVLAWGEMARQVAHEIKNPLTPMRLGMQHLRRVYRDRERRGDFDRTLEETSERVLEEIDRLDTIARAFSRFGAPVEAQEPLAPVDAAAVAREVVQLYALAGEGALVRLEAPAPVVAELRRDEFKEVLVNLLENARDAGAGEIVVRAGRGCVSVADDGRGIDPELLPRIFEPRFSTNTSGSGLGLAIVRRLVESWGGRVDVASEVGRGTVVTLHLWSRDG